NNHVIVIGYDNYSPSLGRMFESKDGGKKWIIIGKDFKSQIKTICSTDSMNAWCATSGGDVYLTDTGGESWEKRTFDKGSSAIKIYFSDEYNGWIYTTYREFFRTSDGGRTWRFLTRIDNPSVVSDFLFYDSNNGLLIGNEISKKQTSSGGSQWLDNTIPFMQNVIATIKGTQQPEQYILLTAHSDCTLNSSPTLWHQAPGADDDGSGIAVLLELARVFSKNPLPLTLKFATVPDEEHAGKGIDNLATTLLGQQNTCCLVLDFDMVGYDYLYPGSIAMIYYGGDASLNLFNIYKNIIASTNIPLNPVGWKDAIPANALGFIKKGIPILGLLEGIGYGTRTQPNYHRISDLWSTINPDYITNITRSVAAFIQNIAKDFPVGISEEKNSNMFPSSFVLEPPYPNPFNSSTTITFGLPKSAQVTLIIYNLLGQQVAQITKGYYVKGYHTVSWDAKNMNSGIYFIRLTSSDGFSNNLFSKTHKLLLLK
ncbi:MAG: M28 family peptidase, partial [Ignavibacteria bacterium]|nr:M28 family peptidase [Ignavibacteria bacterium]